MVLYDFLEKHRASILGRSIDSIRKRPGPRQTEDELENGVPLFYEQLIETLRNAESQGSAKGVPPPSLVPSPPTLIGKGAGAHGRNLLRLGFSVGQVVHIYGTLCEAVTQIAREHGQPIGVHEFSVLNRCLDDAIGQAVDEFEQERDEAAAAQEVEHLGFLVHDLRNSLTSALFGVQAIRRGAVGGSGKTAASVERGLQRMRDLIDLALTQVRLRVEKKARPEELSSAEVVHEVTVTAIPDAERKGLELQVQADPDLVLEADRQMLVSVIANLVHNAIKFSKPGGLIVVRAFGNDNRSVFEVEDECGGLPPGGIEELFRPFVRKSTEPGFGLGLSICARAVQLMDGEIEVHNIPGKGCIFTVSLPRNTVPERQPTPPSPA